MRTYAVILLALAFAQNLMAQRGPDATSAGAKPVTNFQFSLQDRQSPAEDDVLLQKKKWYDERKRNESTAAVLSLLSPLVGLSYAGKPALGIFWEAVRDISFAVAAAKGFENDTGELNGTGYATAGIAGFAMYAALESATSGVKQYNERLRQEANAKFSVLPRKGGLMVKMALRL
jgi:hypothetical protein